MAATDAQAFPVKNIPLRLGFSILSNQTGNPITGGLTSKAGYVSKDGGAFASSANAPVEIGTTGYGYIDLTAAECNATSIMVRVTASNANSVEWAQEVVLFAVSPFWDCPIGTDAAGRATTRGGALDQLWREAVNEQRQNIPAATHQIMNDAGTVVMLSGTVQASYDGVATRGKLS